MYRHPRRSLRATLSSLASLAALAATAPTLAAPWPAPTALGPSGPSATPTRDPAGLATAWLAARAADLGLDQGALASVRVRHVHDLGHGGIVVTFGQTIAGVDVMHDRLSVLLGRDGRVITRMGRLDPNARADRAGHWSLEARDALALAAAELAAPGHPIALDPAGFVEGTPDEAGFRRFTLAPDDASGVVLGRPMRLRAAWFPRGAGLVPAWLVDVRAEVPGAAAPQSLAFAIAAADGAVLERHDQIADLRFRVWAETSGDRRPLAGPTEDFLPNPSGVPDHALPALIEASLVSMNGFNQAPDHGVDPWLTLPAQETRGNNVDAYVDLTEPDGFSNGDLRATATGNGVFDRRYDFDAEPDASPDQLMAAVTQVFYLTNWLHDWYYDSGFDEAAGNAQLENYGRGGAGGDPLHAEADDYSTPDNANMETPPDGASPTMQLGVYSAGETRGFHSEALPDDIATGGSEFGPHGYRVSGRIVRADDGVDTATDACEPLHDLDGAIALVDRGTCALEAKARAASAAGAVAIIIINNVEGAGPNPLFADGEQPGADIPSVSVSFEDGQVLIAALAEGTVRAELESKLGVRPASAIEGTTAAHEWGHYLHMRLVDCSSYQCAAASEGWGDFIALHMVLHEDDDPSGAFGEGIYTSVPFTADAGYFGVRRYPYSTDPAKNPLTLGDIAADSTLPAEVPMSDLSGAPNNETHNAGEVWAEMMFEAYAGLLADTRGEAPRLSFAEAQRRMSDYVVAGMKLAPVAPTYTEQRDAILAAAAAADPLDARALAGGFARRGAGSCALAPARGSFDLGGVVESYDVKPRLVISAVTLDDGAASCDHDGALDAGERGRLAVTIANPSAEPLSGAQLEVAQDAAALTVNGGGSVTVPTIAAFASATVEVPVELAAGLTAPTLVGLTITVTAPSSCEGSATVATGRWTNMAFAPASSATETVDEDEALSVWTASGDAGVWTRGEASPGDYAFIGADVDGPADGSLESPPLAVSTDHAFVMHLTQRYSFEVGQEDGPNGPVTTFYDGGVIELSSDDGATWEDASEHATVPYGAALPGAGGNVLGGRAAFTATNPAWPEADQVTLDFGDAYAGKTVRVRFRIGSDEAVGAPGWSIAEVAFDGLTNTPFSSVAPNVVPTSYRDSDGDGYGDQAVTACPLPADSAAEGGDCDDHSATTFPGAPELCDAVDNNCDGATDEGLPGLSAWYLDADGDGFGSGPALLACVAPPGAVAAAGDCDDGRDDTFPGAPERKGGSVDHNCDARVKADEGCAGGGADGLAPLLAAGVGLALTRARRRRTAA
ncbi:MAG: M36 family metallopeptidase [Myxococcota bacterium]